MALYFDELPEIADALYTGFVGPVNVWEDTDWVFLHPGPDAFVAVPMFEAPELPFPKALNVLRKQFGDKLGDLEDPRYTAPVQTAARQVTAHDRLVEALSRHPEGDVLVIVRNLVEFGVLVFQKDTEHPNFKTEPPDIPWLLDGLSLVFQGRRDQRLSCWEHVLAS